MKREFHRRKLGRVRRRTGSGKGYSRFPSGMTTRKAKAKATARLQQVPFGNDNKKSKSKCKSKCNDRSRFPCILRFEA
jgi:hypothetical protein